MLYSLFSSVFQTACWYCLVVCLDMVRKGFRFICVFNVQWWIPRHDEASMLNRLKITFISAQQSFRKFPQFKLNLNSRKCDFTYARYSCIAGAGEQSIWFIFSDFWVRCVSGYIGKVNCIQADTHLHTHTHTLIYA